MNAEFFALAFIAALNPKLLALDLLLIENRRPRAMFLCLLLGGMTVALAIGLLDRHGFSCWIFSGGGTDFMRTWTADGYGLPPHRVIGSVGETEFRIGDGGPELVKTAKVGVINDGPQKASSIHLHVGQRPILAAGNTDGDLAMLQWTAASPYRTLELVVHHTDGDREYAYDRDPILGSGTGQILAAAAEHKWTVIDMAADWATVHPDT